MKKQIRLPKCLNFVAGAANFQARQEAGRTGLQKLQQVVQAAAPRRRSGAARADAGAQWQEDAEPARGAGAAGQAGSLSAGAGC